MDSDNLMSKIYGKDSNEFVASTIEDQYKQNEGVVMTSFDEDLKNAMNPFILSKKYNDRELGIIEKRLTNTILEKREASNLQSEVTNVIEKQDPIKKLIKNVFKFKKKENNAIDYIEQKYVPFNSKHINLSKSFGNVKVYRDDAYNLKEGDEGFNTSRRYVEINGIRRIDTDGGDYVYQVYDLDDNISEDGTFYMGSAIDENIQLASQEQIEEFENDLYKLELETQLVSLKEDEKQIALLDQKLDSGEITNEEYDLLLEEYDLLEEEKLKNPLDDPNAPLYASINGGVAPEVIFAGIMLKQVDVLGNKEDHEIIRKRLEEAIKQIIDEKTPKGKRKGNYLIKGLGGDLKLDPDFENAFIKRFGFSPRTNPEKINWGTWINDFVPDFAQKYVDSGLTGPVYRGKGDDIDMEDYLTMQVEKNEQEMLRVLNLNEEELENLKNTAISNGVKALREYDTEYNELLDNIEKQSSAATFDFFAKYFTIADVDLGDGAKYDIIFLKPEYFNKKNEVAEAYKLVTGEDIVWGDKIAKDKPRIELENKEGVVSILDNNFLIDGNILDNYTQSVFDKNIQGNKKLEELVLNLNNKYAAIKKLVVKQMKPKYEVIDAVTQDFIEDKLDATGFKYKTPYEQANVMDNMWLGIDKYLNNLSHEDKMNLVKSLGMEFNTEDQFYENWYKLVNRYKQDYYYNMFDRHLAWEDNNPENGWGEFAILDFAKQVLDPSGGVIEKIKTLEKKGKQNSNEYKSIIKTIQFARKIIEAPQDLEDKNGFSNFMTGLKTGSWKDYMPFTGALASIYDINQIKKIADRVDAGKALPGDELVLTMYQLKNTIDGRVRDSSTGFSIGKLSRHMLAYIPEFIFTNGAFTATRSAVVKAAPFLAKSNAGKALSVIIGSLGQGAANPQHYVSYTLENMTPELNVSIQSNMKPLYTRIDKITEPEDFESKYKNGGVYEMPGFEGKRTFSIETGDKMGFAEAFFRGYGVTWAEMFTERLGAHFGPIGKGIWNKLPKGSRKQVEDFYQSIIMSKFMQKFGLKNMQEANAYIRKSGFRWDGIISEVGEEVINQPLSSLIMGRSWDEGFKDENGNWDAKFFKEVGGAILATQLVFSGANVIRMKLDSKAEQDFLDSLPKDPKPKSPFDFDSYNFDRTLNMYNKTVDEIIEARRNNNMQLVEELEIERAKIEVILNKRFNKN